MIIVLGKLALISIVVLLSLVVLLIVAVMLILVKAAVVQMCCDGTSVGIP